MRKSICISMVILLIFLSSCSSVDHVDDSTDATRWIEGILETAVEGEIDSLSYDTYDAKCPEFSSSLKYLTDIVKATYVTTYQVDTNYVHKFNVIEMIRGEASEKTIYVNSKPMECSSHDFIKIAYEKGSNYLLLLEKQYTPFTEEPQFTFIGDSIIIPLSADLTPDLESMTICKYKFEQYSLGNKWDSLLKKGDFIEGLIELTKDNPTYFKWPSNILTEGDREAVLKRSDHVVMIKVDSEGYDDTRDWFYVERRTGMVIRDLKGSCADVKDVEIRLPINKVERGKTYIFALMGSPEGALYLTNINGIYDVSELDEIKDILEGIE